MKTLSPRTRPALVLVALMALLLLPAPSEAGEVDRLARVLPDGNKVVIGMDVNGLRTSPFYKEGLDFVKNQPSIGPMLMLLENAASFDVNRDLHALVMGSPELPASVERAGKLPFTLAVSGTFNQEELLQAARERFGGVVERKEGKISVLRSENLEFGFISANTFVMATGPDPFLKSLWTAVATTGGQRNAAFVNLKKDVGASQHIWLLLDTRSAQASQGPKTEMAGMGVRLNPGLQLTVLSKMASEDDALEAAGQAQAMKENSANDPMMALMGVGPLIQNLEVSHEEKEMRMTSSMTEGQTRALLTRILAILQRSTSLQQGPMRTTQTPAPPADQPPVERAPGTAKPGDGGISQPARQGAPADFN